MMGHPLRAIMYPVWDFAELGEWSGSRPWRPEVQVAGGLANHAHFAGAVQIANKGLDGGGVTFLWAVTELGNLADGKCDVGASVGGEVKQHTNNGAVAPTFFHGRSFGIDSESGLRSWRPIVIDVGHCLNQTFLGGVSVPLAAFLVKLMPRKLVNVPSRVKLRALDSILEKSFLRLFHVIPLILLACLAKPFPKSPPLFGNKRHRQH